MRFRTRRVSDAPPPIPPDHGHPPDDDDNDGRNNGKGGPRPRRGRSPPSQTDPWQSSADPWSASSASLHSRPLAKAPRRLCADVWSTWTPTTTTDASSCTPDPPWVRGRVPLATGTPRLSTATNADGIFVSTGTWTPAADNVDNTVVPDPDPYSGPEDSDSDAVSDAVRDDAPAAVPHAGPDDPSAVGPQSEKDECIEVRTIADALCGDDPMQPDNYIGVFVLACKLTKTDYNGRLGCITDYRPQTQRYAVILRGVPAPVLMRPQNLREICHPALVLCSFCKCGDLCDIDADCRYCGYSSSQRVEDLRLQDPDHVYFQFLQCDDPIFR